MLELTEEQQDAAALALNPPRPVIAITGPAGSGKSTLLSHVVAKKPLAAVLTPTNKAATVLRNKGIPHAATVHSVLYTPSETLKHKKKLGSEEIVYQVDENGKVLRDLDGQPIPEITGADLRFDLNTGDSGELPDTAFIDESSMISEQVMRDLASTFRHVILLGDKFQLPPVKSKDIFSIHPPAKELIHVHRTALENPVLRYATQLRQSFDDPQLDEYHLRQCSFNNRKLWDSVVEHQLQCICFSNKLRHIINSKIRSIKGLPPFRPVAGEQFVALDNIRLTVEGKPYLKFYNGELLTLAEDVPEASSFYTPVPCRFTNGKIHRLWPFWLDGFWHEHDSPRWLNNIHRMRMMGELYGSPLKADYASCLTAHKAQGSEWKNIAVFDQRSVLMHALGELMARRWMYTAVTRAKERCLLVNC